MTAAFDLPLAITMGDPAGIGPEVVLKAHAARPADGPGWLWVGDPDLLTWTARHYGLALSLTLVSDPGEVAGLPHDRLAVWPLTHGVAGVVFGQPDIRHGAAIVESIETACGLALAGRVAGVVTPPISKAVLHGAGFDVPGHTELLARCAGGMRPVMMLVGGGLRVVPATIHQSLLSVSASLTRAGLEEVIGLTHEGLRVDFGIREPRIAVTGLNPHAGEGGAFGQEELEVIGPVCESLRGRGRGWRVMGPLPADTMFHEGARSGYDVAVCMYHDQALIPLKMLAFGEAVNVTLGLPLVRTSVDHGTAFDIAGRGVAGFGSLGVAIALAWEIAQNRRRMHG